MDKNIRILVVEDSSFMQKSFVKHLYEAGFQFIDIATDGNDAIGKIENNDYALIISDWNMPNKDGLSLLKWVRQQANYKNIPFIMATAQGDKGKQLEAKASGANGHISKPFTSDELKEAIYEVFGEKVGKKKKIDHHAGGGKVKINIAHLQITDHLVLGVLKHQIETGEVTPKYFELNTIVNPGWNPIQTDLEKGNIDAALVLAPLAMDLFAFNAPIRMVSLAHKNGSIFVRAKHIKAENNQTLKEAFINKVVNIPHKMSVHNMLAHKFLKELGLKPGVPGNEGINVSFEVVPPVQMPKTMMMSQNIAGFIVAEPIGSNAIFKGIAELQFLSSSIWQNHPCCILAVQESMIQKNTDAVFELVILLHNAGKYAETHKQEAASIAVDFLDPDNKLGLSKNVLYNVLAEPLGIRMNDLYPIIDDFETLQRYMYNEMGIGKLIDLEKFIDLRFADEAVKDEL